MTPFERRESGAVAARFTRTERDLLARLVSELTEMLREPAEPGDPALARLFPDAYPRDREASEDFARYTRDDLAARKSANAGVVSRTLAGARRSGSLRLSPDDAESWLACLTDLRLTLAARLGITRDDDPGDPDPALGLAREAYVWLGYVQESLVWAVSV